MLHAATVIVQISPVLSSDACDPAPSSSNLFQQFKIIFKHDFVLAFELAAVLIALTKAFIVVNGGQSADRGIFARCLSN